MTPEGELKFVPTVLRHFGYGNFPLHRLSIQYCGSTIQELLFCDESGLYYGHEGSPLHLRKGNDLVIASVTITKSLVGTNVKFHLKDPSRREGLW